LDYGAGSGVLGLAACAVDKRVEAVGIDIDFDSCRIANTNAKVNGLRMRSYLPPLSDAADDESKSLLLKAHAHAKSRLMTRGETGDEVFLPHELGDRRYDICVANILAGPLIALSSTLASMIRPGGLLGLSGILPRQGHAVAEAYQAAGFEKVKVEKELGGWVLVTGQKGKER
jgi:ribosomal protein L11 methyltransferase